MCLGKNPWESHKSPPSPWSGREGWRGTTENCGSRLLAPPGPGLEAAFEFRSFPDPQRQTGAQEISSANHIDTVRVDSVSAKIEQRRSNATK
jgi:hypothetical protein